MISTGSTPRVFFYQASRRKRHSDPRFLACQSPQVEEFRWPADAGLSLAIISSELVFPESEAGAPAHSSFVTGTPK